MRPFLTALIVMLAAFAALPACAAELHLDPEVGESNLWSRADVLRDPTGGWDLADVERRSSEFRPASTLAPDPALGALRPATLWFRLTPRAPGARRWFLHVSMNVDRGELAYRAADGRIVRSSFGMRVPFADRAVASYKDFVPVPPAALHAGTLYVRTVSPLELFGAFELRPESWLHGPGERAEDAVIAPLLFTVGMIVALGLLNCILAVTLRDGIYLWYAVAMFAFVLYDAAQSGIAWRYLWPQLSPPYAATTYVTFILYFGVAVGFCRALLDLPRVAPLMWRAILACYALLIVEELAYVFVPNALDARGLYAAVDPLTTTALLMAIFVAGIAAWRQGNPLARLYCIAFAGVVIGMSINVCGIYEVIPPTSYTDAAAGIGVAWEAVFLSVALADRIRGLNRRAETLQGERDALELVAFRDALTGVPNRRAFEVRLEEAWRHGARTRSRLSVVILDVDHFKAYNDALGHPRGDRVLVRVARAIAGALRRPEDAGADRDDAERVASVVPRTDARPMQLVSAADRALYAAKRDGRDRVALARLAPRWYA